MNNSSDQPDQEPSDSALLDRFQSGEEDAATMLYHRYAKRLVRLASKRTSDQLAVRVDAEDIVQSVFRTFFRRAAEGHYELPVGDELWKLFLVISLNKIRKKAEFHGAAKRDLSKTQAIGVQQFESDSPSEGVLRLTVDELISKLPTAHQGVIVDRINGFEVSEMAQRNKLSRRTVERILQSFRRRLQRELEVDQ